MITIDEAIKRPTEIIRMNGSKYNEYAEAIRRSTDWMIELNKLCELKEPHEVDAWASLPEPYRKED